MYNYVGLYDDLCIIMWVYMRHVPVRCGATGRPGKCMLGLYDELCIIVWAYMMICV